VRNAGRPAGPCSDGDRSPRLAVMPLGRVALIPRCAECEASWQPADEARWQAWLTDDEPPELAFYCPECANGEFGGD
jgi:hypothetical protein